MQYPDLRGKTICLDMYNCDANILENYQKVLEIIKNACTEHNMRLLSIEHSDTEEEYAYSLFAICIQGHIVIHAFPKYGFCEMDTFSSNDDSHPSHCSQTIRKALNPDKTKITILDRGDFGNESDMKPHRRSSSKLIRRTKNIGRHLKKIILKPRGI